MGYILSEQRHSPEFSQEHWRRYQEHLVSLAGRFPKNAYAIAGSDWWYSFDDSRAPHDSSLSALHIRDTWATSEDSPQFCSLTIELVGAHGGCITLRYPEVREYDLRKPIDKSGIHGAWSYDEFTLSDAGLVVHTIEWANGPTWIIKATDLIHEYAPRKRCGNQPADLRH